MLEKFLGGFVMLVVTFALVMLAIEYWPICLILTAIGIGVTAVALTPRR